MRPAFLRKSTAESAIAVPLSNGMLSVRLNGAPMRRSDPKFYRPDTDWSRPGLRARLAATLAASPVAHVTDRLLNVADIRHARSEEEQASAVT